MDNVRGWTNDGPLDDTAKNVRKIGKLAEEFGAVRTIIKKVYDPVVLIQSNFVVSQWFSLL